MTLEMLEHFLVGGTAEGSDLTAEWEADVEQHLGECEECQAKLDALAAEQEFWQTTAQLLDDRQDLTQVDELRATTSLEFCDSMLRSWLEPTDHVGALGRIEEFQLLGTVGVGGMGFVARAWDAKLHRQSAIKIIHPHLVGAPGIQERFHREARLAASLRHAKTIPIYRIGTWAGVPYLVMPFLSETLGEYGKRVRFRIQEVLDVGLQLASGLEAAHQAGVVHRDIKPSNILLQNGLQDVVISDFGLARALEDSELTQTGWIAGTPQFMSPEQARGETLDARSDLYSLGCVLYWMCVGESPKTDGLAQISASEHAQSFRPVHELRPDCPQWLSRMLGLLLRHDPNERIADASQLNQLLAACREHWSTPEAAALPMILRPQAQPPAWSARITLGVCGLMAGVCCLVWMFNTTWSGAAAPSDSARIAGSSTAVPGMNPPASEEPPLSQIETENGAGTLAVGDKGSPEKTQPLDALDVLNLRADLLASKREAYWLGRLAKLHPSCVPGNCFVLVEPYLTSEDPRLRALAQQIFSQNPFQVVEDTEELNPFEVVTPSPDNCSE